MARSTKTKARKPRRDVYAEVTESVIARLNEGVAPWQQPWASMGPPRSMSTGKAYRGVNVFILAMKAQTKAYTSPYWVTYKRQASMGGSVKGEKGTQIVFWGSFKVEDKNAKGETIERRVMFPKFYTVFNFDQVDWSGLPEEKQAALYEKYQPKPRSAQEGFDPVAEAEAILEGYFTEDGPSLTYGGDRAFYRPDTDSVTLPVKEAFYEASGFYDAAFHEAGHSTGHKDRLDRFTGKNGAFGCADYSAEELVAAMTSAMLCGVAGIETKVQENQAAYLKHWAAVLGSDPKLFVHAAQKAQKAADLILGTTFEDDGDDE